VYVLVLSIQVAFRCFYTAVHNKQLYPSFTRASGHAGFRYANIFKAITDEFEIRLLVILINAHHKPTFEMSGHIVKALSDASTNVMIKSVHMEKADKEIPMDLNEIKETGNEAGTCILVYYSFPVASLV